MRLYVANRTSPCNPEFDLPLPGLITEIDRLGSSILLERELKATALCMAAATSMNDFRIVQKSWEADCKADTTLARELQRLTSVTDGLGGSSRFASAYHWTQTVLTRQEGDMSLPTLFVRDLHWQLVKTIMYFAVLAGRGRESMPTGVEADEVIRFALFWRLCVIHDDDAGACAAKCLIGLYQSGRLSGGFPGEILAVEMLRNPAAALTPVTPARVRRLDGDRTPQGIPVDSEAQKIFRKWLSWGDTARPCLLWLQRAYLRKLGSTLETDPIEPDHIQPRKIFSSNNLAEELMSRKDMAAIGESLGNLRHVPRSVNRADQSDPISVKLAPGKTRASSDESRIHDPVAWNRASLKVGEAWTPDLVAAWQTAVEARSVWLYEQFWEEAGFGVWFPK